MEDSLFEDGWEGSVGSGDEAEGAHALPGGDAEATSDALVALASLAGAALAHGAESEEVRALLEDTSSAVANAEPPCVLQFVGSAVFRDRTLVPVSAAGLAVCRALAALLKQASVAELRFDDVPHPAELKSLAAAIERSAQDDPSALRHFSTPNMRCGPLPAARRGGDPGRQDAELYVAGQVRAAHAAVQSIAATPGLWPWSQGVDVIRRLDRALTANPGATLRALEISDQPWTPARSALSMAGQCLLVLASLRVAADVRRSAAHALLDLCVTGIGDGGSAEFCQAARDALPRLVRAWAPTGDEAAMSGPPQLTPHHLRVCSLVDAIAVTEDAAACKGVARLICLLYGLASERSHPRNGRKRSLADLFAMASADMQPGYDKPWLLALVRANNVLPIGTSVQTPDGRFGVVMGPGSGGDPMQPLVQVGQQVVAVQGPVRPVPGG